MDKNKKKKISKFTKKAQKKLVNNYTKEVDEQFDDDTYNTILNFAEIVNKYTKIPKSEKMKRINFFSTIET